jgi:RHS repeat-associated protein
LYSYDAFGNAIGFDPATAKTEHLYSSEQFDPKIGQQYLRQRYYDPTTGRFNRLDPFFGNLNDPLSLHKYLYTHGDPVNGIDPSGLMTIGNVMSVMMSGIRMIGTHFRSAMSGYNLYNNTIKPIVELPWRVIVIYNVVTLGLSTALGVAPSFAGQVRGQMRLKKDITENIEIVFIPLSFSGGASTQSGWNLNVDTIMINIRIKIPKIQLPSSIGGGAPTAYFTGTLLKNRFSNNGWEWGPAGTLSCAIRWDLQFANNKVFAEIGMSGKTRPSMQFPYFIDGDTVGAFGRLVQDRESLESGPYNTRVVFRTTLFQYKYGGMGDGDVGD